MDQVNYNALDQAKNACIEASKKTLHFAAQYGFIPESRLGASANVFALNLQPFLKHGAEQLYITLLPEGLGTADDARPDDLSDQELKNFWHNIGLKTVGVMTNDAASAGMQTILISLYLPSASPEIVFDETFLYGFLDGFVEGCRMVGCVYFSGETPQLKTKILEGKIDIAGALFGILPPGQKPIDSSSLQAGDTIVFVQSSGPHENGFTPLRKLALQLSNGYRTVLPSGQQYWQALNTPSILYTPLIQALLKADIHPSNIEPITGHGWQKLMRSKKSLRYVIEKILPVPEIFEFVQQKMNISVKEMLQVFNYGVGLAIYVHERQDAESVVEIAKQLGLSALIAGYTEEATQREVFIKPFEVTLSGEDFLIRKG